MKTVLLFLIAFTAIASVNSNPKFTVQQLDKALKELKFDPEVLLKGLKMKAALKPRGLCGCRRGCGCGAAAAPAPASNPDQMV